MLQNHLLCPGSPFYYLINTIPTAVPIFLGHEFCRTTPFPGPSICQSFLCHDPGSQLQNPDLIPGSLIPWNMTLPFTLFSGDAWLEPVFRGVHHKLHGGLHVPGRTCRQTERGDPVGWTKGSWETLPTPFLVVSFNPPSSTPTPLYL